MFIVNLTYTGECITRGTPRKHFCAYRASSKLNLQIAAALPGVLRVIVRDGDKDNIFASIFWQGLRLASLLLSLQQD